ncbi:DUF6153 family protein [Prescottella agglutinans]|uniref:DUF2946 domain-containing protein n=1 Tax=Prescottella agglutinans TaxID=1644129 RepID=A0ABT6MFA5_9NOCA|nr:DUF6153 family protein [Prescottella agglutinans]MDH6282952.1 hypothetical protein [Prescottella agglutinans]
MAGHVRASITRAAALCALVFGVLAMHHVTTAPLGPIAAVGHHGQEHAMAGSESPTDPTPAPGHPTDHPAFHMCLAVLLAATLALAVWLLLRTARAQHVRIHRASGPARRAGRAPPFTPTTSEFLSSLCMLRV